MLYAQTIPANAGSHYVPDKNHSTIAFEVDIMSAMSKVTGKFTDFDADLAYDPADPAKSTLDVHIKCASIDTGIPDRDKDLRGPAFFDCDKNPEITFATKQVVKAGKGLDATGDFTMHGVTRPITLRISSTGELKVGSGMQYGFSGTTRLNRHEFGMNWTHSDVPNFIGDNVDVRLFFLFRPKPAPKPATS